LSALFFIFSIDAADLKLKLNHQCCFCAWWDFSYDVFTGFHSRFCQIILFNILFLVIFKFYFLVFEIPCLHPLHEANLMVTFILKSHESSIFFVVLFYRILKLYKILIF